MKICYLADAGSIHTERWVSYFAEKRYKIDVISFTNSPINNVDVHFVNIGSISSKGSIRNWKYLTKIKGIKNLISDIKPDILHAHYLTSYGFIGSLMNFHPYVITAHGSDVLISAKQSLFLRFFVLRTITRADLITSDAHCLSDELILLGADSEKIVTFQYGIDLEKINTKARIPKNKIIVSTRAFERVYNLSLLIQAIPLVLRKIPDAHFVLIGNGSQLRRMEEQIHKIGVSSNVKFLGKITHEKVIEHLFSSTIYISTSLSDGTSVSLLEAMATGCFPVVTDIPANREWIQDNKNGFLIPTDNPKILAKKIIEAFARDDLKEESKAINIKIIREKADFKKNMQIMEQRYIELLRSKS